MATFARHVIPSQASNVLSAVSSTSSPSPRRASSNYFDKPPSRVPSPLRQNSDNNEFAPHNVISSYNLTWNLNAVNKARSALDRRRGAAAGTADTIKYLLSTACTSTSLTSQIYWLALYFFFNLSLTLYNKGVLVHFPFPYTLTALHALCGSIGGYILQERGVYEPRLLTTKENFVLASFSTLYTLNIAVSNLSLGLVTIPFHQVVRAATPIFVMAISASFFRTRYSSEKLISLLPVIAGVGFATFGDYYFTTWGFILTLLGTVLAALKTVFTNVLQASDRPKPSMSPVQSPQTQQRSQPTASLKLFGIEFPTHLALHPLDLLARMSPLAFIQCVAFAHLSGELDNVRSFSAHQMSFWKALALSTNGLLAFGLNIVSFTANRKVGPLSMTVAANVKQVLTILIAVFIFSLTITPINALGILLTILGGSWYAALEYKEKASRKKRSDVLPPS